MGVPDPHPRQTSIAGVGPEPGAAVSAVGWPPQSRAWSVGHRRPSWIAEVLLVLAFYAGYDSIRGLIRAGTDVVVRHCLDVPHSEHLFALSIEHPVKVFLTQIAVIEVPACFSYASLHFLITPGVLAWTYVHQDRYRAGRSVIALISAGALVGFWLFPPRRAACCPAPGSSTR